MEYSEEEKRQQRNRAQREYDKRTGYKAHKQYRKQHMRQFGFTFSLENDREIIEKLDSVENKAGYVRGLIAKDIGIE